MEDMEELERARALVRAHLNRMQTRLEAAIALEDGAGARMAKWELSGALELALLTDLIGPDEHRARASRMVEAYCNAVEARVLRED